MSGYATAGSVSKFSLTSFLGRGLVLHHHAEGFVLLDAARLVTASDRPCQPKESC